jgi:hypothetical protein
MTRDLGNHSKSIDYDEMHHKRLPQLDHMNRGGVDTDSSVMDPWE